MTVTELIKTTGISRDRICRACKRLKIEKHGKAYWFPEEKINAIIEDIESILIGNPEIATLRKKCLRK